ncbi:MAG: vitamin B12-dependent ribonucleotide reductase [Deltaproteobacteria bacterium]|nr:vitamin B12-dependent ribonucleotide reductase [Deltaproteobacteria bacterium]
MRTIEQNTNKTKEQSAEVKGAGSQRGGLKFSRVLTKVGVHPYDEVDWQKRSAAITNDKGEKIFELTDVEVPTSWSQLSTNVVVSKYFRSQSRSGERERSIRQIIDRVVNTIAAWGRTGGYFASEYDSQTFEDELTHILLNQMASFNSPVWFNMGIEEHPQASACFINSVDDTMDSILQLASIEASLFKGGSGSGSNLSTLRSSREKLSSGGQASGPVSFMRGYDAFAGVIKSGGKTRRAAKMVMLNVDHPDILEFINCKVDEEKKAWALIEAGYGGDINGEAYGSVFFQNSNNSVRVTDEFMQAVLDDRSFETKAVLDGAPLDTLKARDVMHQIAEATHMCGDPGLQFDDTINNWHTCKASGRIRASNPCSEYMFLDNSACNLASLNLMRFVTSEGEFDTDLFRHAVDVMITAQEIIVDPAKYPTESIKENSHAYRPLGLGYANLGALLMSRGIPYDSDAGRAYAAAVTSLMTGEAYAQSARIAGTMQPFTGYEKNAEPMLQVLDQHIEALDGIDTELAAPTLLQASRDAWTEARRLGNKNGLRNAQVTVLAPTGTIAFMMDCDTTGVEPDIALVKYKRLVGGGMIKMVNQTVRQTLIKLGYNTEEVAATISYIEENGTIEGAPDIEPEHLPVFDCAFKAENGVRSIEPMGHLRMMGAVQPFISGAISKTVNVPASATIDEIFDIYVQSWKLGLKAVAIYRDASKRTQPLSTSEKAMEVQAARAASPELARRRLPDERRSLTHKFDISGHEGYLTAGMYHEGYVGEIFIRMAKEGSVVSGLMDSFATAISLALQYGVPLEVLVDKFTQPRFEPSGITRNPQIPIAKSIMDYIFRWLQIKFLQENETVVGEATVGTGADPKISMRPSSVPPDPPQGFEQEVDAPPCPSCGSIMVRSGACHRCLNCGSTSGCS